MVKNLFRFSVLVVIFSLAACNLNKTATPTAAPTLPPADPPTPPPITHTVIPIQLPEERTNNAGDHDSSKSKDNEEAPGGDRFTFAQYERPFNANTMDVYFPYLDIQDTQTFEDDLWVYATIQLKDRAGDGTLAGRYAMEIDNDLDGRGDWLILADHPTSTDWTTEGVQVWMDSNEDVGGTSVISADEGEAPNDGFDAKVFDGGSGNDPDAAWVRVPADIPNMVEIAVKRSLVLDGSRYMIGMWAGSESLNPALFDFNDHMTHEQAGAAMRGFEIYYPIKALSELDASCRVAVGFQPNGSEPGLCKTYIPGAPGEPPPPGGCPPNPNCRYGMNPDCSCIPPPPPG